VMDRVVPISCGFGERRLKWILEIGTLFVTSLPGIEGGLK